MAQRRPVIFAVLLLFVSLLNKQATFSQASFLTFNFYSFSHKICCPISVQYIFFLQSYTMRARKSMFFLGCAFSPVVTSPYMLN